MGALRFVAAEAWHEFRAACRGPFIPIAFPALVGYVLLVVLNADYMRDLGGTDVPRNSPHLIYLMTSGQAIWLLFAWAWLFAQAVVRDRSARLHELVLSAPVSLPALLAGRYLGALAAGCLLVVATGVGFLLVPILGAVGLIPPEAVGPAPIFAIGHALLVLALPSAAGVGALSLCAAIRTRGLAGPFALAAVVMLVWMVAMIVLRGGDANVTLASYIDPSGFAEVEEQTIHTWTPREKAVGVLELTPPLIANRVLWSVPALILLVVVLRRVGRERLALESALAAGRRDRAAGGSPAEPTASAGAPLGSPGAPSWVRAAWNETAWHLGVALRGWGTPLALLLLAVAGVAGTFVNLVMHADGPFMARPDLTGPFVMDFFYLIIVFVVAAFVGVMARRDDRTGYGELVDSTPAPLGSRVAGLAAAAATVTVLFAMMPALSVWILTLLGAPEAFTVLPALGHDPDRLLRAPQERRLHGLDPAPGDAAAGAVAPAAGVAPAGDWRWTVTFAGEGDGTHRSAGTRTAASGRSGGPLDFAFAWWPGTPVETRRDGLIALHGAERTRDAGGVLDDVAAMRACVAATLGRAPTVGTVLQAPRERGETVLYGDLLWLPEHEGWDIAGEGYGRWLRRATIASAVASRQLADAADLRKEPGEDWLRVGVPGWVGLECVRQEDGVDAWRALQARASDRVVEAFAALDAPAVGVAAAGDAPWVRHYTPLATVGWVETMGTADAASAIRAVATGVRNGATLADALAGVVGADAAAALLGPPAASDLLVEEAERTLDIAGHRWTWRDGGWEPVAASIHATQRFDGDGGRRRIGPVPTTVDPGEPFMLIDARPSFERSPSDNVWRGDGDD